MFLTEFIIKLKNKPNGPIHFKHKRSIFEILIILEEYGYLKYEIFSNLDFGIYTINIIENKIKNIYVVNNGQPICYKKLNTQLYSYILHTNRGILYHEDAIKFKVGGTILFKFS